jgi:hypothetical protein
MSGEHVGTTSGLIVTSGKSEIWPLAAPENQGFRKLRKFPRGEEIPRQKGFVLLNSICEEAGRCRVCWEKRPLCTCYYEHQLLSVRQGRNTDRRGQCRRGDFKFSLMDSWSG